MYVYAYICECGSKILNKDGAEGLNLMLISEIMRKWVKYKTQYL